MDYQPQLKNVVSHYLLRQEHKCPLSTLIIFLTELWFHSLDWQASLVVEVQMASSLAHLIGRGKFGPGHSMKHLIK
jgi:hypothetical protein